MYVHGLYILNTDECVTILLVDKTTIVMIYKGSYKIPKTEWVILFVILMSHRAAYHIQITKGKGSECFTASKTPVGHVMTWFRIVRNNTPRSKAIVPDCPNLCKFVGRAPYYGFESFDGYLRASGDWYVEFMTCGNGISISSLRRSIGLRVIMFFSLFYFDHVGY